MAEPAYLVYGDKWTGSNRRHREQDAPLIRCVVCHTEWELDYEPPACTCQGPTGGWWQISHDGGVWSDQAPLEYDGDAAG